MGMTLQDFIWIANTSFHKIDESNTWACTQNLFSTENVQVQKEKVQIHKFDSNKSILETISLCKQFFLKYLISASVEYF